MTLSEELRGNDFANVEKGALPLRMLFSLPAFEEGLSIRASSRYSCINMSNQPSLLIYHNSYFRALFSLSFGKFLVNRFDRNVCGF